MARATKNANQVIGYWLGWFSNSFNIMATECFWFGGIDIVATAAVADIAVV